MLLAFGWAGLLARRDAVPWQAPLATLGLAAFAAPVGGRLWALLEWWAEGGDVQWVFDPFVAAGYSSPGAFVGAGAAMLAARGVFGREAFARIADIVAPAALLALALTRLGCVIERCDPGRVATWFGVRYPDGVVLHPFGAYIAVPAFVWLIAVSFVGRNREPGWRALLATGGYGAIRFVAEFAREAPAPVHAGHLVALGIIGAVTIWWVSDRRADGSS